ncbi:phage tail protein [Rhodococcus sp. D2-41]|uniref:Gp37-like protein n=1 Tax=Speluncibacter jeojiensis TaxID=2710754 RepID=UPI0024103C1D|nr:phage tail protein [Rhodococcus sp. D2-41]MDG3012452.1 phage tail protein [Rhodococcus sp. D2-41]
MTAPVLDPQVDFDAAFEQITEQLRGDQASRIVPPLVRLWDGDWNLRGICKRENSANFQLLDNETGTGALEMPVDYFLAKWAYQVKARKTTNIHITVDKDGARWSGRMDECLIVHNDKGERVVRILFKHDYEELKHILVWSNPFLPAEIQFPKLWVLFGPAKWALKTTLLVNIMRLEASLWMLPDDPMNPNGWFNFDQSTWSMVVKPDTEPDRSVPAIVHSRFKTMHETSQHTAADAQLSWEARRYLAGDPPPWPGANLRPGCLVFDLVDKSAWNTGTSFGGDLFGGLIRELINIGGDGMTETVETVPDPNIPDQYRQPGFKGTIPSMPAVVFRDGEHTGIQSAQFSIKPATDVGMVAGGKSAPGVNEAISAAIIGIGGFLGSLFGQSQIGPAVDAVLKPLYWDTVAAWGKWKDTGRARDLGWSHYHEGIAPGGDRAYTLSWLLAMRTGMWQTRGTTSHTVTVVDGCPWRIGERGHGHFFLGDRIGTTVREMPGQIFVDRVSELVLAWDRDTCPTWKITVGARQFEDPVIKLFSVAQDFMGMLHDLGVM